MKMDCPVWLDQLITKMIASDPRDRPHTAKAVIMALDELRKFDKTQKATVSQIAGSFNALTAGNDKTEAQRLLGQRKSRPNQASFFQSTGFLIAALTLVLTIIVFALIPASSEKLMTRARGLMASEEPTDWLAARDSLQEVISRGEDSEYFQEAEDLYYESRRRALVLQAEKGRKFVLQSLASQKFLDAVKQQREGDDAMALASFEELIESVDENGDERHIHWESSARIAQLRQRLSVEKIERFRQTIESFREAESVDELEQSLVELENIHEQIPEGSEFEPVADLAEEVFAANRNRLASRREKDRTDDP